MNVPVFVISDLHIGSGGVRDSFEEDNRSRCFQKFLDYIEKEDGELIILGDFIDLWRFSLNKVIKTRTDLLDRLAQMKVSFVPGNHDQALTKYINSENVPHPFFRKVTQPFTRIIGDRKISFMHGHELDIINRNLTPRMGRFLGFEYAKGSPVFSSDSIEEALLNIEEKLFLLFLNIAKNIFSVAGFSEQLEHFYIMPRQKRIDKLILKHEHKKNNDGAISAHTHRLCKFQDWYFNSGSWTDRTNDFLRILPDGKINLFNWQTERPKLNNSELSSSDYYSKFKSGYIMAN